MKELHSKKWQIKVLGVFFALGLALLTISCNQQKKISASGAESQWALVKDYSKGALHITVRLDKQHLNVAQTMNMELLAETDENYNIKFQKIDGNIDGFTVSSSLSKPRLTGDKRLEIRKTYNFEPQLAGEYILPAITVSSWKQGEEDTAVDELHLSEIAITVTSLFASDEPEPVLSDVAPPVAAPWNRWFLAAIGLGVFLVMLLLFWLLKRRKHKKEMPPPLVPAHIKAHKELDMLLAEGLLLRGEIKEFYGALSNILRHYIEDRFGIKAPERTTEEFLSELGTASSSSCFSNFGDRKFVSRHKAMLQDFLSHCDLVKFAKHRPGKQEIDGGVSACREFIDQTTPSVHDNTVSQTPDPPVLPQISGESGK